MSDVGSFYIGFGLLFAWAAVTMSGELIRAACAAATLTALLHFVFHAAHVKHFSAGQAALQTTGLAIAVVLPVMALLASRTAAHGR